MPSSVAELEAQVSVITQFDGLIFTYRDGPARMKSVFDRLVRKVAAGARPWVEVLVHAPAMDKPPAHRTSLWTAPTGSVA